MSDLLLLSKISAEKVRNVARITLNEIKRLKGSNSNNKTRKINKNSIKLSKLNNSEIKTYPELDNDIRELMENINKMITIIKQKIDIYKNENIGSYIQIIESYGNKIIKLLENKNKFKYNIIEKYIENIRGIIINTINYQINRRPNLMNTNDLPDKIVKRIDEIIDLLLRTSRSINNDISTVKSELDEKEQEKEQINEKISNKISKVPKPFRTIYSTLANQAYTLKVEDIKYSGLQEKERIDKEIDYLKNKLLKLEEIKRERELEKEKSKIIPKKQNYSYYNLEENEYELNNFMKANIEDIKNKLPQTNKKTILGILEPLLNKQTKIVMNNDENTFINKKYEEFLIDYFNLIRMSLLVFKYLDTKMSLELDFKMNTGNFESSSKIRNSLGLFEFSKKRVINKLQEVRKIKIDKIYPQIIEKIKRDMVKLKENIKIASNELSKKYFKIKRITDIPNNLYEKLLEIISKKKRDYELEMNLLEKSFKNIKIENSANITLKLIKNDQKYINSILNEQLYSTLNLLIEIMDDVFKKEIDKYI